MEYGRSFFGIVPPTYVQALRELLTESDPWLQSCAAYAVADQRLSELQPELETLASADVPLLQETVRAAHALLFPISPQASSPGGLWKP